MFHLFAVTITLDCGAGSLLLAGSRRVPEGAALDNTAVSHHVGHLHILFLIRHDRTGRCEEVIMFLPVTVLLMTDEIAARLTLLILAEPVGVSAMNLRCLRLG